MTPAGYVGCTGEDRAGLPQPQHRLGVCGLSLNCAREPPPPSSASTGAGTYPYPLINEICLLVMIYDEDNWHLALDIHTEFGL